MVPREQYWDKIQMFLMWWQLDRHQGMDREMGYFENFPLAPNMMYLSIIINFMYFIQTLSIYVYGMRISNKNLMN